MERSFQLGRVAGIPIGIHYTWLFAFALIAWSLARGLFPSDYPGWGQTTYWLVGILAALGLFASVLVHELSHSLVALARGHGVHSITLFIFGGVSNIEQESETPQDEFLIAVVGPLTSFILAALFWLSERLLAPGDSPLGAILGYLALINVLLGLFNLLPGFPLDGGRVLRSVIWVATGSEARATRIASSVGQGFGLLLIFWGVWQLLGGNILGGFWIAVIGWFLYGAAGSAYQQQVLQENLHGVRVADLMNPQPPLTGPDLSVEEFVFEHVIRHGSRALLVVEEGRLRGIVSVTDVRAVPHEDWASTPVGAIMTAVPLKTVAPEADVDQALRLLVEGAFNQLPVVVDGRVVGLLSRADIMSFLQLRQELNLRRLPGRRAQVTLLKAQRETEAERLTQPSTTFHA